jgi:hypothetical protein
MATASHAAGSELRLTVWAVQVLALDTGGRGFERYRLIATVIQNAGLLVGKKRPLLSLEMRKRRGSVRLSRNPQKPLNDRFPDERAPRFPGPHEVR